MCLLKNVDAAANTSCLICSVEPAGALEEVWGRYRPAACVSVPSLRNRYTSSLLKPQFHLYVPFFLLESQQQWSHHSVKGSSFSCWANLSLNSIEIKSPQQSLGIGISFVLSTSRETLLTYQLWAIFNLRESIFIFFISVKNLFAVLCV